MEMDKMPRTRAERRKADFHKASHKRYIVHHVYGFRNGWYDNLHEYSKNKIHCSCPMCSAKTNRRRKFDLHGYSLQDQRRVDEMDFEEDENKG